jgi:hypothetical protein
MAQHYAFFPMMTLIVGSSPTKLSGLSPEPSFKYSTSSNCIDAHQSGFWYSVFSWPGLRDFTYGQFLNLNGAKGVPGQAVLIRDSKTQSC